MAKLRKKKLAVKRYPANRERKLKAQYGGFFRDHFQWCWFATFTFSRSVSKMQALAIFTDFVREASRVLRAPIAYAGCVDYRDSGSGMPTIREHLHVLLNCSNKEAAQFLSDLWRQPRFGGSITKGAGADIRPYDPSLGGAHYVIKHTGDADWEILERDLDLASHIKHAPSQGRARFKRRQKRHLLRSET